MLANPRMAALSGAVLAFLLLVLWAWAGGVDALGLTSFAIRFLHVLSGMVWVGLIVFINFVQLEVSRTGDDATRSVLHSAIAPAVAWWVRHSSTATVASGFLLLVLAGYALPSLVYGSAVYLPPARSTMLWLGVLAAFAMWTFVHMYIWPNMQVVIGLRPGDAAAKAEARARVVRYARANLLLAIPVTLVMIAAAHLY